jgi:hypothetical protein
MGKVTAAGPSPILTGFPFELPKERQCYDAGLIRDFLLNVKLQAVPKPPIHVNSILGKVLFLFAPGFSLGSWNP